MSNQFHVDEAQFSDLRDKVVVLTGGANGIGASIVSHCAKAGAKVVFGDSDISTGQQVAESLQAEPNPSTFLKVDVTKYEDNIKLFKTALEKHGRIDHAIACAGILERGKWFDPDLTIETVEQPETNQVLDVNLLGTVYFARIAVVYLRHGMKRGENKSLTLLASAAGFRDSPGLFIYQCTKHGVMGLLRTTRKIIYQRDGIRINAICPAMTDTNMTTSIIQSFVETGQAINTAADVAKYTVSLAARADLNGKAIYVEGGRGWEFMDGLDETMPQWLGEGPTERLRAHLKHVQTGDGWKIQ